MLSGVKCMKCIISVYECQVYHYYVVLSESENMIPEKKKTRKTEDVVFPKSSPNGLLQSLC